MSDKPQLWLTLIISDKDVISYVLPPMTSLMVGRDESANEIVLHHPNVSRTHARIAFRGDHYAIQDLGSTKGTFVNGKEVLTQQRLESGDIVKIGPYLLRTTIRRWQHRDESELDRTISELDGIKGR